MRVLVIKDNKPGHYNQTAGIVLALQKIYLDLKVDYCEIEIKNKISRKLLRYLLNVMPFIFKNQNNLKYIKYFYKKFALPVNKPDLIVSTGGNTSNLNAWLALAYGAKNILNGALRGLRENLFSNITTVTDLGYKNQIILDVAPSEITKEKIIQAKQHFAKTNHLDLKHMYYALLIGGDGGTYKYDDYFYEKLISFCIDISTKQQVKWLITTSRRTPLHIEQKIRHQLIDCTAYFVAYNEKPENVLLSFFGLSDIIFVTEDSSSMISEAIASGKCVITISEKNTNFSIVINKFLNEKKLYRINLSNKSFDFNQFKCNKNIDYQEKMIEKLKCLI